MGDIANQLRRRRHMTSRSGYIHFEDSEVERVLIANGISSDGIGITYDDAAAVTNLGYIFRGNQTIQTFDELEYFTNFNFIQGQRQNQGQFYNCTSLRSIRIPEGVTVIPGYVFQNCSSLTDIGFPRTLTTIASYSFNYTRPAVNNFYIKDLASWLNVTSDYVTTVSFSNTERHIYLNGIELTGHITIPENTTIDGVFGFAFCKEITSVTLPNSLERLGQSTGDGYNGGSVFSGCTNLTSINLPSGLKEINYGVFRWGGYSGTLELPSGLTRIGSWAFADCPGITGTITIPAGVTTLYNSFPNCSGITGLEFANDSSLVSMTDVFTKCTSLTGEITLPTTVTSVTGNGCFANTLVNGTFSAPSVTGVFKPGAMGQVTRLIVPEGVTEFYGNINPTSGYLDLPSTVTNFNPNIYASPAKTTVIRATSVPANIGNLFTAYCRDTVTVYVPYSADHSILNNYKNAVAARLQQCFYELNSDGTVPTT